MNQRLSAVYDRIRPGRGVIDVGTDHGYLPVRLALEGYPGQIFASDIRRGPLETAKRSAERYGVSNRIHFLLTDGLEACPPNAVDTIVIAGMGGDTICGILDRAEWCMDSAYRLLLQPMTKAEVLRYWLSNNGFTIVDEALPVEGETVYQLLAAEYTGENETLRDTELYIGKLGYADRETYHKLLLAEETRIQRRINGLQCAGDSNYSRELAALRQRLDDVLEVRMILYGNGKGTV